MNTKYKEVNWNPSTKEKRDFGRLLLIGFPFVALFWAIVIGLKGKGFSWNWELFTWIAGIGCGIGLFCFLLPSLARPIYCLWFFLVCIIDTVITIILLPSFYYVILLPYALIIRMLGKTSLKKGPQTCVTYWNDVAPTKDSSQYYQQY